MADPTRGDFPASWYAPQAVSRFSSTSWPASAMQYAKNGQSVKCSLTSSTPSIEEGLSPELPATRPSLAQAGCNNSLSDHQKRNVLLYLNSGSRHIDNFLRPHSSSFSPSSSNSTGLEVAAVGPIAVSETMLEVAVGRNRNQTTCQRR